MFQRFLASNPNYDNHPGFLQTHTFWTDVALDVLLPLGCIVMLVLIVGLSYWGVARLVRSHLTKAN